MVGREDRREGSWSGLEEWWAGVRILVRLFGCWTVVWGVGGWIVGVHSYRINLAVFTVFGKELAEGWVWFDRKPFVNKYACWIE
jgi:hypothetical protein